MNERTMKVSVDLSWAGGVFLVFLFLKLAGLGVVANWSWWWITSPLWIAAGLALLIVGGIFFWDAIRD